ncbi:MAG: hypothetical protein Hyperionvirus22_16 [Hyperionvirus sp.]|uniref:Uncharacterized protein n=1 Tax=Hyperionvirus sp. TaxID=2487770 RepID=A0A3G5AAQ8_9VIRU|nr:MAG: hypothetical protein Hyperionvirus22_16 [Hyperionvirus sp.]
MSIILGGFILSFCGMADEGEIKSVAPPTPPFGNCTMRRILRSKLHPGIVDLDADREKKFDVKKNDTVICKKCMMGRSYDEDTSISYENFMEKSHGCLIVRTHVPTYYFTCELCRLKTFVDDIPAGSTVDIKAGDILECHQCDKKVMYNVEFKATSARYVIGDEVAVQDPMGKPTNYYHTCTLCKLINDNAAKLETTVKDKFVEYRGKFDKLHWGVKTTIPAAAICLGVIAYFMAKKYRS